MLFLEMRSDSLSTCFRMTMIIMTMLITLSTITQERSLAQRQHLTHVPYLTQGRPLQGVDKKKPQWPYQFRMDVYVAKSMDPSNVYQLGRGTVYYDALNDRSASYILLGPPNDTIVIKQVYSDHQIYTIDLATGKCFKRHVRNQTFVHQPTFLDTMHWQGDTYLKRGFQYLHTDIWQGNREFVTPFGDVHSRITYYHANMPLTQWDGGVPLRIIYEDQFCPFLDEHPFVASGHPWFRHSTSGPTSPGPPKKPANNLEECNGEVGMARLFIADYDRWILGFQDIDTREVFHVPFMCNEQENE